MIPGLIRIEQTRSIIYNSEGGQPQERLFTSVRLSQDAFSSGWIREHFGRPDGPTDFLVMIGIAQHTCPLYGNTLDLLIDLGVATKADAGQVYACVTDAALAGELGLERETVNQAAHRLAEKNLIRVCSLPDGWQFNGTPNGVPIQIYIIDQDPSKSPVNDREEKYA